MIEHYLITINMMIHQKQEVLLKNSFVSGQMQEWHAYAMGGREELIQPLKLRNRLYQEKVNEINGRSSRVEFDFISKG